MKAWEKTFWRMFGAALVLALATWMHYDMPKVHAQAPGPSLFYANGPVSTCPPLPIPNGGALLCIGSDHVVFAPAAGTKYLQLDSQTVTATGVQKVNGTAPGATGNVTVSCAQATGTIMSVPAVSGSNVNFTVPTIPVVCAGTGS